MNRYRLVWLVCDPFSGGRIPIGALIEESGAVSFVVADRGFRKALSPAQQSLADVVCAELSRAPTFDVLPAGVGPQVIAGEPTSVPRMVIEPGRWVRERVLQLAA